MTIKFDKPEWMQEAIQQSQDKQASENNKDVLADVLTKVKVPASVYDSMVKVYNDPEVLKLLEAKLAEYEIDDIESADDIEDNFEYPFGYEEYGEEYGDIEDESADEFKLAPEIQELLDNAEVETEVKPRVITPMDLIKEPEDKRKRKRRLAKEEKERKAL